MRASVSIGERIRNTREAKKISQHELARSLGITSAAVCQWETKGTTPRSKTLRKVAEALGVSEEYLSTGDKTTPTPTNADSVAVYLERVKKKIAQETGIDVSRISLEIKIQR